MDLSEKLTRLMDIAKKDAVVRERLLATEKSDNPLADFCAIAAEHELPISVMELINEGEEFYAEIKRSTNGGGENSPDLDAWNDEYSIFMMRLKDLQ
ncbi:hypothetical protein [Butyrivibrio sp. MC2013]|uniref:hypothetical protein n=1 Tax=Butyrivibrio sp. MC2013 TaxID=1280686 RepID=UPI0004271EF0|nr:hypothetical protein [Butyrivibrio sp. MC2013]